MKISLNTEICFKSKINKTKQYDYIDIVRGIAILGVIAVHSHQKIQNLSTPVSWIFNCGQLGVQLFFVASALTLCLSAEERKEKKPYDFYIRRFFRVAPLYYLGIFIYFIIEYLRNYLITGEYTIPNQYTFSNILTNILLIHGLYAPGNNNIVPGGWSIGTEILFYLLFPLIYKLSKIFIDYKKIIIIIIIIFIYIVELLIQNIYNKNPDNNSFVYFSILNQFPVFVIGIYTYLIINEKKPSKIMINVGIFFGIVACIILNTSYKSGFNGFISLIVISIFYMVLIIYLKNKEISRKTAFLKLKNIGKISYSMYIWHFLVIDILIYVLNRSIYIWINQPEFKLIILFLMVTFISCLVGRISKKNIEDRGVRIGHYFIKKYNNNLNN